MFQGKMSPFIKLLFIPNFSKASGSGKNIAANSDRVCPAPQLGLIRGATFFAHQLLLAIIHHFNETDFICAQP